MGEEMYYLYHIHLDGMGLDEGYIGVTKDPKERWRKHSKKSTKAYVSEKIRENKDKIKFTILSVFDTKHDALWAEYTLRHKMNMGWNIAIGGATCPMNGLNGHSEETKKKMSKSHTGLKRSKEHCENISKANKGRKLSAEHIANMIGVHVGHKSAKSKPANIYNYYTDELVAENVIIREWCRERGWTGGHSGLYKSITADHTKPSSKHNVRHSKGFYAKYIE